MADTPQFPFQLTPVDYDPFSEAYAYSQKLAKQQQDNALMTRAVGMPAQGPTAAETNALGMTPDQFAEYTQTKAPPAPGFIEGALSNVREYAMPRAEDYTHTMDQSAAAADYLIKSGKGGMLSGNPWEMAKGAGKSMLGTALPVIAPVGAALEAGFINPAERVLGPAGRQAAEVATMVPGEGATAALKIARATGEAAPYAAIFAGPMAKTADIHAFEIAKDLATKKADLGEIPELGEAAGGPIPHEAISPALYKMYKWVKGDFSHPASNPSLQIPADKQQMVNYLAGKISHNDFALHPDTTLADVKHPLVEAKASFEANPNLHLEKVNPDVMLENHPMKGAINDFAADPFEQTKVGGETEKLLHGFLEDYTLDKAKSPKLGDKEVAIPYNKQNLHDYLSGKISYNEFSNKATQAEFEHPYVNPKLYNEMQLDLPANKAHTPEKIMEAKKPKTEKLEPFPYSSEAWDKDWQPPKFEEPEREPAAQAPNWTYTNPESLANRYSRPATEPPQSSGKEPYHIDDYTGEEYGPAKYEPHLKPLNWSEVKGKSPQNLLTPDMPTYGPAMEQGYNPNLLLHRGQSGQITGQAWWDPSTKPRERGLFAADEPRVAKAYGQNQYPAVGAFDKPMEIDWPTATVRDAYSSSHMPGIIDAARAKGADLLIIRNIEDIVSSGKAAHDQYVVLDPGKLRDPQLAKFDPAKKGKNDLLAGIAGGTLGLPVLKSLLAPTDEGTKK